MTWGKNKSTIWLSSRQVTNRVLTFTPLFWYEAKFVNGVVHSTVTSFKFPQSKANSSIDITEFECIIFAFF
jgi:hypothetical protein